MTKIVKEIEKEISNTSGVWGVYVKDLKTKKVTLNINSDMKFPSASIGKLPIALYAFSLVADGEVSFDDPLLLVEEYKLGGSGVLRHLHSGLDLSLLDVITLMLVVSDNTSAKLLVKKFTPQKINEYMTKQGFEVTKLKIDGEKFGYGMTTPKEISILLEGLYSAKYFSKELSDQLMEILRRSETIDRLARFLPSKIRGNDEKLKIPRKSGSIPGVRSEVGIVLDKTPYVISVLSKDIKDDLYSVDNEAVLTIAKISKLIYDHFIKK